MIVVVTGHRPDKLWDIYDIYHPLYLAIGREMRAFLLERIGELKEGETLTLVTGMALGIDTVYALVSLRLKNEFPDKVKIFCAIPCKGHSKKWNKEDQNRYKDILSKADVEHYTSNGEYSNYLTMYKRDEFMVDMLNKDNGYVISVWNGFKSGGTYHTVNYAKEHKKELHNINPLKYSFLCSLENDSDIVEFTEYIKLNSKQYLKTMLSAYNRFKSKSNSKCKRVDLMIELIKKELNS